MFKYITITALLISTAGCGSFGTTALYRHANDSVSVQKTNHKLKGLPVKLKVPSHMHVTVYEQQVILANSAEANETRADRAQAAAIEVETQKTEIEGLESGVANAKKLLEMLEKANTTIQRKIDAIPAPDSVTLKALNASKTANVKEQTRVLTEIMPAAIAGEETLPTEKQKLASLVSKSAIATRDATIKYSLISFNPAQYVVENDLQYTDKVFLVDFKRPLGGVLDLKEASMDDEQYFAKIQAEVEERTLSDIGTALSTIKDPLSNLVRGKNKNTAVPTSAGTPTGEANDTVNFQRSVVATKRFDISEPDWEERLQSFVNLHLQTSQPVAHQQLPIAHGQATAPEIAPNHDYYSGSIGEQ